MKTEKGKGKREKRTYHKPEIEIIKLDNEISLVMGTPPNNPEKTYPGDDENNDEGKTFMNPFKMQNF